MKKIPALRWFHDRYDDTVIKYAMPKNYDADNKFRGKYRIPSVRLRGYDYSQNGAYFVTICVKNCQHIFGKILNGKMKYSEIGKIARDYWRQIPDHFSFVMLGEWIIMPNHLHGIIIINNPVETPNSGVSSANDFNASLSFSKSLIETPELGVSTRKNLGIIVNQYKRACTIQYRKINANFTWQPRFHDRIIRDENEFNGISEYIIFNPQNWENDEYF